MGMAILPPDQRNPLAGIFATDLWWLKLELRTDGKWYVWAPGYHQHGLQYFGKAKIMYYLGPVPEEVKDDDNGWVWISREERLLVDPSDVKKYISEGWDYV